MYDGKEPYDGRGTRLPKVGWEHIEKMFKEMEKREGNWASMLVTKVSIKLGTDDVLVCVTAEKADEGGMFVQFAGSGSISGALGKIEMYGRTGQGKWSPDRYA